MAPHWHFRGRRRAERALDAAYAGLGTEADFAGKDVRGRAVFVYGMPGLADQGAVKRADQN